MKTSPFIFPQRKLFVLTTPQSRIELGRKTCLMGIVNITPDSFSEDGCFKGDDRQATQRGIRLAQKHVRAGAEIIDIGGESSRPGAKPISVREELARILPTVRILAKSIKVPISVDTYKPEVAQQVLDAGASVINNIQAVQNDRRLLKIIRDYRAAVVLMHMRGRPQTMQKNIRYANLIQEILLALRNSIEKCLEIGIDSDKIIIDPGIGFGKTVEHNLEILGRLSEFQKLKCPILVGTSRKSFIGKVLNKEIRERLMGTAATGGAAILAGAHILRVHDVAAMRDVAQIADAILNRNLH